MEEFTGITGMREATGVPWPSSLEQKAIMRLYLQVCVREKETQSPDVLTTLRLLSFLASLGTTQFPTNSGRSQHTEQ